MAYWYNSQTKPAYQPLQKEYYHYESNKCACDRRVENLIIIIHRPTLWWRIVAMIDNYALGVFKNYNIVLQGHRNTTDRLWDVHTMAQKPPIHSGSMNVIIQKDKTPTELVEYLHKSTFSPYLSTVQNAKNNGYFITWPGIDK